MFCLILPPSRLYKETAPSEKSRKKKDKDKKKKKKKDKKKKKKRSKHQTEGGASTASSAEDEDPAAAGGVWSVVCLTLKDWEDLTERYSKSKKKCDRELHETLSESFLPEIVKMFAEKEREERRKLLMLQPKRASSRIERKKQEQEERDRVLAEKVGGQLSTAFPASLQCLKCFFLSDSWRRRGAWRRSTTRRFGWSARSRRRRRGRKPGRRGDFKGNR